MDIKYINHLNEELDLSGLPYLLQFSNAFDFSWEYETFGQTKRNCKIKNFTRQKKTVEAEIIIKAKDFEAALNRFAEITEKDIIAEKAGKLVFKNEMYLMCFLIESKNTHIHIKNKQNVKDIIIISPHPFWIKEMHRTFPAVAVAISEEHLDYPYDYSYDYAGSGDNATWFIDHYAESNFEMIIYGPCIDPRITINGHPYYVYDTVEKGEYIKINSEDNTVIKYRTNGTTKDLYDYRGKIEGSLFEKIPSGNLSLGRNGNFGFDLKLFLERSEPAW